MVSSCTPGGSASGKCRASPCSAGSRRSSLHYNKGDRAEAPTARVAAMQCRRTRRRGARVCLESNLICGASDWGPCPARARLAQGVTEATIGCRAGMGGGDTRACRRPAAIAPRRLRRVTPFESRSAGAGVPPSGRSRHRYRGCPTPVGLGAVVAGRTARHVCHITGQRHVRRRPGRTRTLNTLQVHLSQGRAKTAPDQGALARVGPSYRMDPDLVDTDTGALERALEQWRLARRPQR